MFPHKHTFGCKDTCKHGSPQQKCYATKMHLFQSVTFTQIVNVDVISANVRQPAPEATISRNVAAADVAEPEAADGHEYEQLELQQNSFGRGSTGGIYERVGQQ